MREKMKIWGLITLSYLTTFGTPIGFGYYFFAERIEAKTGGGFLYIVVSVTGIFLITKILLAIRKWKASAAKALIKATITLGLLYVTYTAITYISFNFEDLATILLFTMLGRVVATIFEVLAIRINKEYVEEIGVI